MMGHAAFPDVEENTLASAIAAQTQRKAVRMEAAVRIAASRRFSRSPLLSNFLLYIVTEAIEGRGNELTEHKIGVAVFDRPRSYRTVEDNIVRTYARQLRRRLEEHYAAEGCAESIRIEIPKGGYVPSFLNAKDGKIHGTVHPLVGDVSDEGSYIPVQSFVADSEQPGATLAIEARTASRLPWVLATVCLALALCTSVAVLARTWIYPAKTAVTGVSPNHELWKQLFTSDRETLIVPADTALVTVEDMNQRQYSLTEYLSWSSVEHAGQGFDSGLRIRKYTDIESLEITDELTRLAEWKPDRAFIRTPSNIHVQDLNDENLILIGSAYSIPWIQLLESNLSFRLVYEPKFGRAHIENRKPAPGEAMTYANQWNGVNETDYAVLAFMPNLNHQGHILMLEGLDGSGMYAIKGVLFSEDKLQEILKKSRRPDGTLRPFEALLEATSVDSHPTAIRVVSVHVSN